VVEVHGGRGDSGLFNIEEERCIRIHSFLRPYVVNVIRSLEVATVHVLFVFEFDEA